MKISFHLRGSRGKAIRKAAEEWTAGKYHDAINILDAAGFSRTHQDAFVRKATMLARQRYEDTMAAAGDLGWSTVSDDEIRMPGGPSYRRVTYRVI